MGPPPRSFAEARAAEQLGQPDRVGGRVGKRRGVLIGRVSDDQRDATFRGGRVCKQHRHEQAKTGEKDLALIIEPNSSERCGLLPRLGARHDPICRVQRVS